MGRETVELLRYILSTEFMVDALDSYANSLHRHIKECPTCRSINYEDACKCDICDVEFNNV